MSADHGSRGALDSSCFRRPSEGGADVVHLGPCRRYLAYHFAPNTDMYKERNAQAFDGLIEAGDHRLLANTAQPPFMPRRRAWQ